MIHTFELVQQGRLIFDAAGLLGLGLVTLGAIRLNRIYRSWGAALMAWGAAALLAGRTFSLIAPYYLTREVLAQLGYAFICVSSTLPLLLLTGGFGCIVWGLWGHERWLNEEQ